MSGETIKKLFSNGHSTRDAVRSEKSFLVLVSLWYSLEKSLGLFQHKIIPHYLLTNCSFTWLQLRKEGPKAIMYPYNQIIFVAKSLLVQYFQIHIYFISYQKFPRSRSALDFLNTHSIAAAFIFDPTMPLFKLRKL